MMVGREARTLYSSDREAACRRRCRLCRVEGLRRAVATRATRTRPCLHDVDLEVRAARSSASPAWSAPGAPRSPARSSAPIRSHTRAVLIDGQEVRIRSPRDAIRHGIGLVPEDRKQQALFLRSPSARISRIAALDQLHAAGWVVDEARETRWSAGLPRAAEHPNGEPGPDSSPISRAATSRRSCWRAGWRSARRC